MTVTYRLLGRNGRLGNQLWQIAATLGVAAERRTAAVFPPWAYAPAFSVPACLFGPVPDGAADTYDHPREVPKPYRGYLQELDFIRPAEADVRAWFQPSAATVERLEAKYPWFHAGGHRTAVHVRRGDVLWPHAVDLFRLVGMDYYDRALRLALDRRPDTLLVVCSDDIEWCWEHLPHDRAVFVSPPGIPEAGSNPADEDEFFLMLGADAHICANSTFSWWASWLSSDPSPIAPATWFKGNLAGAERLFLPDSWTLL